MSQKFLKIENGKVKQEAVNTFSFSISCIESNQEVTIPTCRQLLVFNCFQIEQDGCLTIEDNADLVLLG